MMADQKTVLRLLKTARGQMDGIIKMVEEDRYCIDISNQILATEALLKKANREVLRGHLEHCVKDALQSGNGEKEKIDELMSILEKMNK